jgi:hypothetical protein
VAAGPRPTSGMDITFRADSSAEKRESHERSFPGLQTGIGLRGLIV